MLRRFSATSAASVYFDAVEVEAPGGPGGPSPPSSLGGMGKFVVPTIHRGLRHTAMRSACAVSQLLGARGMVRWMNGACCSAGLWCMQPCVFHQLLYRSFLHDRVNGIRTPYCCLSLHSWPKFAETAACALSPCACACRPS